MKRNASSLRIHALLLGLLLLVSACQPVPAAVPSSTPCPTPSPSPFPTLPRATHPAPSRIPSPTPDHQQNFLESLPSDPESCHPDDTRDDIGVYIYDLKEGRELVSVNADVPFQYASVFKAPVLLYFLSSCRAWWDPASSEWEMYFQDPQAAKNVDLFTSPEYEQLISGFIADPTNWNRTDAFFLDHRQVVNGAGGNIDTRYFVLEKVYSMIAQSSNPATADVLKFVNKNCTPPETSDAQLSCGGPNAITGYNAWFDEFTGIVYEDGEARRGLYSWDSVIQNGKESTEETVLSTFGLKDTCANRSAVLNCDPAYTGFNTYTARDLFRFYQRLYELQDASLRETALALLKVDEPGPARGYLKNMARGMQAISFSKNGHAFFTNGSINADAGILLYKGKAFVVVTLSFNAVGSNTVLYGSYDGAGNLVGEPGLIQNLLESYTVSP